MEIHVLVEITKCLKEYRMNLVVFTSVVKILVLTTEKFGGFNHDRTKTRGESSNIHSSPTYLPT